TAVGSSTRIFGHSYGCSERSRAVAAATRSRGVSITTSDSSSLHSSPFHTYVERTDGTTLPHATSRSSTSVRTMRSASAGGTVVRTRWISAIVPHVHAGDAGLDAAAELPRRLERRVD